MAQNTDVHNIERSLGGIEKTLERIEKNLRPTTGSSFPTTQQSLQRLIEANKSRGDSARLDHHIPLEIDWTPAAIRTEARVYHLEDGRARIVIDISGEDADILLESIPDTPVEYLQLSSVAR